MNKLIITCVIVVSLSGCAGMEFDPSRMNPALMNASSNFLNPGSGGGYGRAPVTCQQQGPYTRCW